MREPAYHADDAASALLAEMPEARIVLDEACQELRKIFGSDAFFDLERFDDPECATPASSLTLWVRTDVEDSQRRLDWFDEEWWFDNVCRAPHLDVMVGPLKDWQSVFLQIARGGYTCLTTVAAADIRARDAVRREGKIAHATDALGGAYCAALDCAAYCRDSVEDGKPTMHLYRQAIALVFHLRESLALRDSLGS
jgi:hypothetical protein